MTENISMITACTNMVFVNVAFVKIVSMKKLDENSR